MTTTIGFLSFSTYTSPAYRPKATPKGKRTPTFKPLAATTTNTLRIDLEDDYDFKRNGLHDYFHEAKKIITHDNDDVDHKPRWFTPSDCGPHAPHSPLLLYLPGIDGLGLGLITHHQPLSEIFEVCCLHIPVKDRTSFNGLMKLIEIKVRSEMYKNPNRPIYLVGESLGACLALSVAASNTDLDLVLILANPGTSYNRSMLSLTPLVKNMPEGLLSLSALSLLTGGPFKWKMHDIVDNNLPIATVGGAQSNDNFSMFSHLPVVSEVLPKETFLWRMELLSSAASYANARIRDIKAQTLVLCSGKDELLPSIKEGERLRRVMQKCIIRKFHHSGHCLLLEDGIDLVTIIKRTCFYRRGEVHDYVYDFVPPTAYELKKLDNRLRLFNIGTYTSPVMLSTLDDGKIVRGLSGIPLEGPVLFVGNHMYMGAELMPMLRQFLLDHNILLRGLGHPILFYNKSKYGFFPDLKIFDIIRLMGAVPVSASYFSKLLSSNCHVLMYPGGGREALHRKGETHHLFWPERSEFVRMAAKFGATIVPFGVVGEDDVLDMVLDYNDQMEIPILKNHIETMTFENIALRTDAVGEVSNQQIHLPYFLPKIPGRFYYYFGKPIQTRGREQELINKNESNELYIQVKNQVEECLAYLKIKREEDPYRSIWSRLKYRAMHGFSSEVPTFDI